LTDACSLSGGDNDYGYVEFAVELEEVGSSGTSWFATVMTLERREIGSEVWTEVDSWTDVSPTVEDDASSRTFTAHRSYSFTRRESENYYHRLWVNIQFWAADVLAEEPLHIDTIIGDDC
jgi:hypothetical protein